MKDAFAKVTEFHRAHGHPAPDAATLLPRTVQDLRYLLIEEEYHEYFAAAEAGDLVAIADALADLAYVVIGTAVAHGLTRFGDIFDEVHRSNMSKLGEDGKPIIRDDGKVMKPDGWEPPDIKKFLEPL